MKRGLKRDYCRLRDGRKLSYIVDRPTNSDETTPTVFYFHGMYCEARYFVRKTPPEAWVGVYVDRPGYGKSDPVHDASTWSYGKLAQDIEDLANHLKIEKFHVLGHSSGGPCALACGAHLSDRVAGIADVAGDPEYARQGAPKEPFGTTLELKYCIPVLLCLLSFGGLCGEPGIFSKGAKADYTVERKPYDFQIACIQQPTLLVRAGFDKFIPSSAVEFTHQQLPNSEIMTMANATHISVCNDNNLNNIVRKMLSMID